MKDVIILVATGFEDTELITTIDVLSRNEITYDLVSVESKHEVKGKVEAIVKTKTWKEIEFNNYRALFLPGGPGYKILLESKHVQELVQDFAKHKIIAAICAAPEVLLQAQVLNNKTYTSYPGHALSSGNTGQEVEVDGNLVTGRDYEATIAFAKAFVKLLQKN